MYVGFLGRQIQICYLKFQGSQGICHGNQILAKISQHCTDFSSAKAIEDFFARVVRLSGPANSNMLSKMSREPRKLPWQPKLDKKSQNSIEFHA